MMTKSKFFRILKERGVYSPFLRYVKRRFVVDNKFAEMNCNSIYAFIDKHIRSGYPQEIIMEGFTWADTAEGEDFWSGIYSEIHHKRND